MQSILQVMDHTGQERRKGPSRGRRHSTALHIALPTMSHHLLSYPLVQESNSLVSLGNDQSQPLVSLALPQFITPLQSRSCTEVQT